VDGFGLAAQYAERSHPLLDAASTKVALGGYTGRLSPEDDTIRASGKADLATIALRDI